MDFQARLKQANSRLKNGKIKVRIEVKGNRLVLRGTFPSPIGGPSKQSRIYTGLSATPIGLQEAERRAKQCHVELETGKFSWDNWKLRPSGGNRVSDWITRYQLDYFNRRESNPQTETTWKTSYLRAFKALPQDQELTPDLLTEVLLSTPPDTHQRRVFTMAFNSLAKFAGLEVNLTKYRGNYQFGDKCNRIIPTDQEIVTGYYQITNPLWACAYGLIATFGLRPHEIWFATVDGDICRISSGKTGPRLVWAFPRDWITLFNLTDLNLPIINAPTNKDRGATVSRAFKRYGLGFVPYDLRHAWAIRTMRLGLDISLAAQQMGHSLTIHSKTYHRWISEVHHQEAYDRITEQFIHNSRS